MKKRIKIILLVSVIVLAAGIVGRYFYFKPIPLLQTKDGCQIVRVLVPDPSSARGDLMDLDEYDEAAILDYLSTCTVRRTFVRTGNYSLSQVSLGIVFFSPDEGFVFVYLGEINYSYNPFSSKFWNSILNADKVRADLLEILHLG